MDISLACSTRILLILTKKYEQIKFTMLFRRKWSYLSDFNYARNAIQPADFYLENVHEVKTHRIDWIFTLIQYGHAIKQFLK